MTVVDLVRILRRNLIVIAIGALLGMAIAAAYVLTRPTVYTASATGVVMAGDSISVGDTLSANSVTVQRAGLYASLVGSANVATRTNKVLAAEGMSAAGAGGVSASADANTPFIHITATGKNARDAQALANATIQGLKSEALHLETFGKAGGRDLPDKDLEGMTSMHIMVYTPAGLPGAPAKPHLIRNLAYGGFVGAVIAGAFAVARRAFDAKVRSQQDVEKLTGKSALGIIPESKEIARTSPDSVLHGAAGESMRQLRTNLRFVSVDSPPRSIVITSPAPGDGKSTIAAHLARLLAAAGEKVVLIDCDLRLPTQADQFDIDGAVGLTQVLTGDVNVKDALVSVGEHGLLVLPAGRTPPNPSELLGSRTMRSLVSDLGTDRTVILDAPPVLAVTDAALLGGLADGVVIVTRMGSAHKAQLEQCARLLQQSNANLLGSVMNRASTKAMGDVVYGYGYGYGSYGNAKKYGGYYYGSWKSKKKSSSSSKSSGSSVSGSASTRPEKGRRGRRRAKDKASSAS